MPSVALVFPGNDETRRTITPATSRFANLFQAFDAAGFTTVPVVYHDDFAADVRARLLAVDVALVWVNPIQDGRDRTILDALLREVAEAGVFVSTHPDVILQIGTKQVLYDTRQFSWGSDVHVYATLADLQAQLPARLAAGPPRVLKQFRGHSGDGIWKVQLRPHTVGQSITLDTTILARHAKRGSLEEELPLAQFFDICAPYFENGGRIIDQAYQDRLPDGMVRCYLVGDRVAGLGLQAINALYPAPAGAPPADAPPPGPRLYYPPTLPEYQSLITTLETEWVPALQQQFDISNDRLPILWDCDFLSGPKTPAGDDTYVLCEINVSSVAPYPDSVVPYIVTAIDHQLAHR